MLALMQIGTIIFYEYFRKDNRLKTIRMFYLFILFVFKERQLITILEMKEVWPKKCGIKQCKQKVFNKQIFYLKDISIMIKDV